MKDFSNHINPLLAAAVIATRIFKPLSRLLALLSASELSTTRCRLYRERSGRYRTWARSAAARNSTWISYAGV